MAESRPPDSYETLGWSFDTAAEFYDRFRPSYANNAFGRLIEITQLPDDARILEIGCGTGQATLPMATLGYNLTAIEPGAELANMARDKLQQYPNSEVIVSSFEAVELPDESFDLIYSAMALHWVDPAVRFAKTHQLLKPGGHLALLSNEPVTDAQGDKFYQAFWLVAARYGWKREPGYSYDRLPAPEELYYVDRLPIDNELFEEIDRAVFTFEPKPRTGLEHIAYMHTLASVLAMPEEQRYSFLDEIKKLIETEFNDQLDYRYATELIIARKK